MSERSVLVCGAGLMGHGIAQVLASAGYTVRVYEPDRARAEAGIERIGGNLERAVAKGRLDEPAAASITGRLSVAESIEQAAAGIEFAVEAVFEDEGVKTALFRQLDEAAPAEAVLASNTSSISISRLAAATRPERRPRVVGMHFFSPVPVMPVIELVRGDDTDDATEAAVRRLAAELEKQIIVSRDRPGFK